MMAEPSSKRMRVSLNCLRKRTHNGSGISCGNSLEPFWSSLASASAWERPCTNEVSSRALVSSGFMSEYVDVMAYRISSQHF